MNGRTAPQHTLERRSALLAQKIVERKSDLIGALQAANGRIPFHTKMSRGTALDWWAQHRYDDLGQKALASLSVPAVMSLDTALAQYVRAKQSAGLPIEGAPAVTNQNAAAVVAGKGGGYGTD